LEHIYQVFVVATAGVGLLRVISFMGDFVCLFSVLTKRLAGKSIPEITLDVKP